jgi:hypothetical protein
LHHSAYLAKPLELHCSPPLGFDHPIANGVIEFRESGARSPPGMQRWPTVSRRPFEPSRGRARGGVPNDGHGRCAVGHASETDAPLYQGAFYDWLRGMATARNAIRHGRILYKPVRHAEITSAVESLVGMQ